MADRIDELARESELLSSQSAARSGIPSASYRAHLRSMNIVHELSTIAREAIAERDALRAASEWLADKWCYDADPAECGCGVDYTPESCLQAAKEATK